MSTAHRQAFKRWVGSIAASWLLGCAPSLPDEAIRLAGQDVVRTLREIYNVEPDIVPVQLQNFAYLDKAYYRDMTAGLEKAGFRMLGDLEFKHLTRHDLNLQTCVRTFIHPDQAVSAAVWYLHKGPKLAKEAKGLEFETEFSDGKWLTTRNRQRIQMRPDPERVTVQIRSTSAIDDLFRMHQEGVQKYLQAYPSVQPIHVRTLWEVIDQQKRQAQQERQYRQKIQGITEKELRALGEGIPRGDIPRLLKEVQRLYSES